MYVDTSFLSVSLAIMAAAIGTKILTSHLLARMHKSIWELKCLRQERMNSLRKFEAERETAEQNRLALERKKVALEKKLDSLKLRLAHIENGLAKREIRSALLRNEWEPSPVVPLEVEAA